MHSLVDSTIRFIKMYPNALDAMPADASALGTVPAAAIKYCEALRSASSFGWYIFPAKSIQLRFDGFDTYVLIEDEWEILDSEHVDAPDHWWNQYCPAEFRDMAPPFLTAIGNPGHVQIWSGLLVQTKADWSTLVRPIANLSRSGQFTCFEGIVETDAYGPAPLFINLRLTQTNTLIPIPADQPLFQVQPIHRSCYAAVTLKAFVSEPPESMTPDDWAGYRNTIRTVDPTADTHQTGAYAVKTRRRSKQR